MKSCPNPILVDWPEGTSSAKILSTMGELFPVGSMAKLSKRDATLAQLLKVAPWITVIVTSLPGPLLFLFLFLTTSATDSAALYLLLAGLSLAVGFAVGLLIAAILLIYRRRWLAKLRDRLASDGITASEVVWFRSELTSAERAALDEIQRTNPLLADAYMETLASRLAAASPPSVEELQSVPTFSDLPVDGLVCP